MPTPADHAALLRRTDYPVPPHAVVSDADRQALTRYGYWLEGLAHGRIAPATPEQERFVRVSKGQEPPASAFEHAWANLHKPAPTPAELADTAARLQELRQAATALQQGFVFRQLDVMARVQPELDAIQAEMQAKLKPLQAEVERLEAALKDGVRRRGSSFWHRGVRVTYSKPRITFDNKALQQYAETHPDINQFRKVGQPIVSIRYDAANDPDPDDGPEPPL